MRPRLVNKPLTVLLGVLLCTAAQANPLESELRNVLESHPGIRAARLAIATAENRVEAARASLYPRVNLNGDAGREKVDSASYPFANGVVSGSRNAANRSELDRSQAALNIEQNLWSGGRREASIAVAVTDKNIQELNLDAQTQDVLLEAITAYLQVARYLTLIRLATLNQETTERQLELERKRVDGGGGIQVDVLQARTRLQIVRERKVFYEQGLRDVVANYEQVFLRPPNLDVIQDLLGFDDKMPASSVAATARALDLNPRLKVAAHQIERAGEMINLERAGFSPSLDLVAAHTNARNVQQIAQKEETSVVLRMNWNLFSGFETTSRARAAVNEREEQRQRELVVKNRVIEMIRVNWNQVINGKERVELLDSAAGIARDVMEDRKRLRDAGKEPALAVLDSEVEYYGVLANKVNAIFDTRINSYKLLSAMGELTSKTMGLDGQFRLPVKPLVVSLETIAAPMK
ncbi:MAG: hypothetical protein RI906_3628 [Pseudomonadota bacterium]